MRKININWYKYSKYLLFLGIILTIGGLVSGNISGNWSTLSITLVIIGGILIIFGLASLGSFSQRFWQKRATQSGTNAFFATVSVVIILGLINFLAIRYANPLDLTETKIFTLSPQTQEIVQSLSKPLKVWVFTNQNNDSDQALLEKYQRYNKNFEFEFVDPNIKLGVAQRFNIQSIGEVHLEYGDKKLLVQNINPVQSLSEVQLTTTIEKILRDRTYHVYFTQGHGEVSLEAIEGGFSQAVTGLENKGFEVKPLNLAENPQIPDDASLVIIAGSEREFLKGEVALLKEYLDGGGNLLLMIDLNSKPGLDDILKSWGVQLNEGVVIDPSSEGLGFVPTIAIVTNHANHPITRNLSNGISIYPLSRPVGAISKDNIEAVALLSTSEQSWGETNLESEEFEFNEVEDIPGPIDLAVLFTRSQSETEKESVSKTEENSETKPETSDKSSEAKPETSEESSETKPETSEESSETKPETSEESSETKPETSEESSETKPETSDKSSEVKPENSEESSEPQNGKKIESKMLVFGSSIFASNGWFEQQLNSDVFLNSVTWLATNDEQTLSIRPREAVNRRIKLSPLQSGIIAWMAVFIVPILGFIIAAITWWRRR
jgi:ABC-type uncharacterized transport system involved in gliding motility auxiliary subunit